MRLVLAFSGFLAATAAASDAARGTLLSTLTGRVDDAAAADRDDDEFADFAAPAKVEGDVKNVSTVELWYQVTAKHTTGAPLEHTHLTPNHLVKSMIAEYKESKG